MAKKKVLRKEKLLPHREVTVKSRAYGEHTRAVRGSKTPAVINEVLQENVRKTGLINNTAKRVHDLLKECAQPFKEKMLWQGMLSRMRTGLSDDMMSLLTTLKGMELNSNYKLERFVYPIVKSVEWDEKSCEIIVSKGHPLWKHDDTEYCYEVFLLLLGKAAEKDSVVSKQSEWIAKDDRDGDIRFALEVPKNVMYYLVCLHFMTGNNGKQTGTLASRGMKIMEVRKKEIRTRGKAKTR